MKRAIRSTLLLVVAVLSCRTAAGDGKFFPEAAFEKAPDIPAQRALVRFKDGRETLIIEAAVDSESKNLGWVIPLPAVPEKMEEVKPGLFESLTFCLGARITHDLGPRVRGMSFLCALIVLFVLGVVLSRSLVQPLLYVLIVAIIMAVATPNLLGKAGTPLARIPGIEIAAEKRVGSYDVKVLRAETPGALDEWLKANGFAALGSEEKLAISDYIRERWCFFAAKLVRDEAGQAIPHPISFEFPAKEAVYPIKLTGLSGSSPYFEIFVVGDQAAEFPHLHTALCDRFSLSSSEYEGDLWKAEKVGVSIGHPALTGLLWDGCVVTRLRGTLTPEQMKEDVTLGWRKPRPHRDHFYSTLGAMYTALIVFFLLGSASLLAVCVVRRRDFGRGGNRRRALLAILVTILASVFVGAVVFASLPKKEVTAGGRIHPRVDHVQAMMLGSLTREATEKGGFGDSAGLRVVIRQKIEAKKEWHSRRKYRPPRWLENPYRGGLMREEASPGNYEVREEEGEVRVYYYDRYALPKLAWASSFETD